MIIVLACLVTFAGSVASAAAYVEYRLARTRDVVINVSNGTMDRTAVAGEIQSALESHIARGHVMRMPPS